MLLICHKFALLPGCRLPAETASAHASNVHLIPPTPGPLQVDHHADGTLGDACDFFVARFPQKLDLAARPPKDEASAAIYEKARQAFGRIRLRQCHGGRSRVSAAASLHPRVVVIIMG